VGSQAIEAFIDSYRRQENYYRDLAASAARILELSLDAQGIRAIVTSRPKAVERLRSKITERDKEKRYESADDIRADIRDLAGIRLALYFPSDLAQVCEIIESSFIVSKKDDFPKDDTNSYGHFPGYCATHYTVQLRSDSDKANSRYLQDQVEIQIATVFMHAWSEVEHDLRYKPATGAPSEEELLILEQLNGISLSAETMLRSLQAAVRRRAASAEFSTANHFELAALLANIIADKAPQLATMQMGRADILYHFLSSLNLLTVDDVRQLLIKAIDEENEKSIVDKINDVLLKEDPERANAFAKARDFAGPVNPYEPVSQEIEDTRGEVDFLRLWQLASSVLAAVVNNGDSASGPRAFGRDQRVAFERFRSSEDISIQKFLDALSQLEETRFIRNEFVHGTRGIPRDVLRRHSSYLRTFIERAASILPPDVRGRIEAQLSAISQQLPG
jgi:ppGpp synthetase/RelA/SpoT-type nucleotidyltranferase